MDAMVAIQKIMKLQSYSDSVTENVQKIYHSSKINGLITWLIEAELKKTLPEPVFLAKMNIRLGKKSEALKWLNYAVDLHLPELPVINNDPDFEILRRDTRFQEIIKKLGLSEQHNPDKRIHAKPKPPGGK